MEYKFRSFAIPENLYRDIEKLVEKRNRQQSKKKEPGEPKKRPFTANAAAVEALKTWVASEKPKYQKSNKSTVQQ